MPKLITLREYRNSFVSLPQKENDAGAFKRPLVETARRINERTPVLRIENASTLVGQHLANGREALEHSPIAKEDAPSLKGPVYGISYSEVQNAIDSYDSSMTKSHKVLFVGREIRGKLPLHCAKF